VPIAAIEPVLLACLASRFERYSTRSAIIASKAKTCRNAEECAVMTVTLERLESAIDITIEAMTQHSLPQLLPTLKRLEAERDKLVSEGDPLEYAKRLRAQRSAAA
jgi:hypothetical protein